jgi:toxin ParE1/3/4
MTLPVVYRRAARVEFGDAVVYYEARRPHLGIEFVEEVERCIGLVTCDPMRFPIVHREIRRAAIRRFPYSLYFRVEPGRIVVLSVFHGRRNPNAWKGRE